MRRIYNWLKTVFARLKAVFRSETGTDTSLALHTAIQQGNFSKARTLVEEGADVNKKDTNGLTPLELVLQVLLQNGAEVGIGIGIKIIKLLLQRGASVRTENACAVLCLAAKHGHIEIIKTLLQHLPQYRPVIDDQNQRDELALFRGEAALHHAARNRHIGAIKVLIQNGANVNIQDDRRDRTALHLAVRWKQTVKVLIKNGASINIRDGQGFTALHAAAVRSNDTKVIKVLIQNGADVNTQDSNGCTPLRHAIMTGHTAVVKVLLKHGADINIGSTPDCTTLRLARSRPETELVELIMRKDLLQNTDTGQVISQAAQADSNGGISKFGEVYTSPPQKHEKLTEAVDTQADPGMVMARGDILQGLLPEQCNQQPFAKRFSAPSFWQALPDSTGPDHQDVDLSLPEPGHASYP